MYKKSHPIRLKYISKTARSLTSLNLQQISRNGEPLIKLLNCYVPCSNHSISPPSLQQNDPFVELYDYYGPDHLIVQEVKITSASKIRWLIRILQNLTPL